MRVRVAWVEPPAGWCGQEGGWASPGRVARERPPSQRGQGWANRGEAVFPCLGEEAAPQWEVIAALRSAVKVGSDLPPSPGSRRTSGNSVSTVRLGLEGQSRRHSGSRGSLSGRRSRGGRRTLRSRVFGFASAAWQQHRHKATLCYPGDKGPGASHHQSPDARNSFRKYLPHLLSLEIPGCEYKRTHPCPHESTEFGSTITDFLVFGEDDPPPAANIPKPVLIASIRCKFILVHPHFDPGFA